MNEKEQITDVVFRAIENVNQQLTEEEKIPKSLNTELVGPSATVDSLALVSLIVAVEEGVQESFGKTITLASEQAMLNNDSPFKNVNSLVEYIQTKLKG